MNGLTRLEGDKEVDITVRSILASRHRAKDAYLTRTIVLGRPADDLTHGEDLFS